MSLHRLGALLGAYTLVGLGMTGTILVSQRYLPSSRDLATAPSVEVTPLPQETPTPAKPPEPLENVDVVLDLLHQEYLSPVSDRALFASSFKLLKEYLKSQKLDVKNFPALPPGVEDRAQLTQAWKAMIATMEPKVASKFDHQKLVYLALKGMLGALKDPYCSVLEPKEFRVFEEHMTGGNFSGIGVMIELDRDHKNRVTVAMPIEGGPASKAGIQSGDVLLKIDGQPTQGWDIEKAANKIRGPQGSTVVLSILRPKEKKHLDISVQREMIHVPSCRSKMAAPKIGYLNVQVFAEETGKEFEQEIEKLKAQGAEALVLDLRNNGGGYINAALEICSHMVDREKIVVSVVNERLNQRSEHKSLDLEQIKWPCVVLVNRFSASASEITAGCLQDHKRAELVGETTFGKASVQQLERLADGGAFKYTVAHYLTPSGKDIHLKGIKADVNVKVSEKDKDDKVLEAGIKILKDKMKP